VAGGLDVHLGKKRSNDPLFVCRHTQADNEVGSNPVRVHSRVARWFVFKTKIPIWVNFGGPSNEKSWYIL
jgi:hypothetical protein